MTRYPQQDGIELGRMYRIVRLKDPRYWLTRKRDWMRRAPFLSGEKMEALIPRIAGVTFRHGRIDHVLVYFFADTLLFRTKGLNQFRFEYQNGESILIERRGE